MNEITRTKKEIDDQLNEAQKYIDEGSKYFGMSYEDGIVAMFDWLVGNSDALPMEE
jgi:hypothetical protein